MPDPTDSTKKIKVNVSNSPRSLQRPAPATTKRAAEFNAVSKTPVVPFTATELKTRRRRRTTLYTVVGEAFSHVIAPVVYVEVTT